MAGREESAAEAGGGQKEEVGGTRRKKGKLAIGAGVRSDAGFVLGFLPASRAGALLHLFEAAPNFAPEAAALFPRKINGILDKMKPPLAFPPRRESPQWRTGLAEALDKMAADQPIRLAFSAVRQLLTVFTKVPSAFTPAFPMQILLRETAVPNLEVTLGPLRRAGFYRRLPKVQKHAAHVYAYFKDISARLGHTGFGYWHLDNFNDNHGREKKYKETTIDNADITGAVSWLEANGVVHRDVRINPYGEGEARFTLDRYQRAMEGVVGNFKEVAERHQASSEEELRKVLAQM